MIRFYYFLLVFLLAFSFRELQANAPSADDKPNVLFLFTDDQRHDTIAALGNQFIETPSLDELVRRGQTFTSAYIMGGSSPAVCSPSRACLFSGRTLWNLENQGKWGYEISAQYRTLPQVFRENGYETFGTGKNEPGRRGHFARSFSSGDKILFRGMTRSQYRLPLYPFSPEGDYSGKPIMHTEKHSAEVYAEACIAFLQQRKASDKPFFAYVSFQTPHDPRQSPEEYRSKIDGAKLPLPEPFLSEHPFDNGMLRIRDEKLARFPRTEQAIRKHLADYYSTIAHTDAQIGRILRTLDEQGLSENTIVVFTADNGLAIGSHGLLGKQNVYEHSVRVPFILAGPGIPEASRRDQLCYIYDIYPTLCDLAGIETPETVQFKSFAPLIRDGGALHRHYLYFAFMSWQRAIRRGQMKLIEYCVEGQRHTQLFDLESDPHETTNLATVQPQIVSQLRTLLREEATHLNDGNVPYDFTNQQGVDFWNAFDKAKQ